MAAFAPVCSRNPMMFDIFFPLLVGLKHCAFPAAAES
jgi:hypothetical protein